MEFIQELLSRIPQERRARNNLRKPNWRLIPDENHDNPDDSAVNVWLKDGFVMAIDADDFSEISPYCISASGKGYGAVSALKGEPNTGGLVHRIVAAKMHGFDRLRQSNGKAVTVDHIDGNILNNRRSNLRLCDHHGNMRNQHKVSGGSKFKGVYRSPSAGKWCASYSLKEPGMKRSKSNHLGTFECEIEAARAYDEAIIGVFGEFATTNASLGWI